MKKLILASFLVALPTFAQQPSVDPTSVTNAASYINPGQVNSGIAQGAMFILKGQGLGTCGVTQVNAFPLSPNMGTTSIKITVGTTSVNALMVYVVACRPGAPDQLAAIVPSNTPLGSGIVTVNSAKPGDVQIIWGTGLGAVSYSDAILPTPGNLNVPVEVWVGGVKSSVSYSAARAVVPGSTRSRSPFRRASRGATCRFT